jgi:hypothetical protein
MPSPVLSAHKNKITKHYLDKLQAYLPGKLERLEMNITAAKQRKAINQSFKNAMQKLMNSYKNKSRNKSKSPNKSRKRSPSRSPKWNYTSPKSV